MGTSVKNKPVITVDTSTYLMHQSKMLPKHLNLLISFQHSSIRLSSLFVSWNNFREKVAARWDTIKGNWRILMQKATLGAQYHHLLYQTEQPTFLAITLWLCQTFLKKPTFSGLLRFALIGCPCTILIIVFLQEKVKIVSQTNLHCPGNDVRNCSIHPKNTGWAPRRAQHELKNKFRLAGNKLNYKKDIYCCENDKLLDCHCAVRPFCRMPPLVSSTGQAVSRSHQATSPLWLVNNF